VEVKGRSGGEGDRGERGGGKPQLSIGQARTFTFELLRAAYKKA